MYAEVMTFPFSRFANAHLLLLWLALIAPAPALGQSHEESAAQRVTQGGFGESMERGWWASPASCAAGTCDCLSPEERAFIDDALEAFERDHRPLSTADDGGVAGTQPPLYPLYPMAGNSYEDFVHINFVDLQSGSGILDYNCTSISYNGHAGIDSMIRSFAAKEIGVPIFAAFDGTVVATNDGQPDENSCACGAGLPGWPACPPGTMANMVIIDHGAGRLGYYLHMRTNSVAVSVGETVAAGQQIGEVASSGCSTHPHLHFESRQNGSVYEPFSGPCNTGPSGWVDQEELDLDLRVLHFATSRVSISGMAPPQELPISVQKALSDPALYFWFHLANLPAQSTMQVQFLRPNDNVEYTSNVIGFQGGENPYYRWSWWWAGFGIADMQTIPGTWTLRLFINGDLMIEAPFEVVEEIDPEFNRPPEPVDAQLDPDQPGIDDAIFCRVQGPMPLADPDFDLVRFRYVWKVGNEVIRDVTTAARSDAIPRGEACDGAVVTCEVTPSDGQLSAPPAFVGAVVGNAPTADLDCNGTVNVFDLLALLGVWGPCPQAGVPCPGDLTGDGSVGVFDLLALLGSWG